MPALIELLDDGIDRERRAAFVRVTGERQEVVDRALQAVDFGEGLVDERRAVDGRVEARHLQLHAESGERRAELVGRIGAERSLPRQHGVESPCRAVQRVCDCIELGDPGGLRAHAEVALAELNSPVNVAGEIRLSPQTGPLQRAGLGIRNRDTGAMLSTAIAPDGKFEFRNVPISAGLYDLTLLGAPGFYVDRVESSGAKASGRSVEIQGSNAVSLAVYVAHGVTQVEGVAQRDGKPVAGAMILLVPRDFTGNPLSLRRDESDSDGTFMLPQVLPGSYTVVAVENGWDQEWSNPAVIKTWLGLGETIDVSPNAKKTVAVKVQ